MDLMLSNRGIVVVGALAYVGLWAYASIWVWCKARRIIDLKEVDRISGYQELAKSFGWILSIIVILLLRFVSPQVIVITKDMPRAIQYHERLGLSYRPDSIVQNGDYAEAFYDRKGYVPCLFYRGHFCRPFAKYVYNDSDEPLEIHSVTFDYDRHYAYSTRPVQLLPPHELTQTRYKISEFFRPPLGPRFKGTKRSRHDFTTQYYIDLPILGLEHQRFLETLIGK